MISIRIICILSCLSSLFILVEVKNCKEGSLLLGITEADNQCKKLGYGYACLNADTCRVLKCAHQGILNWDGITTLWACQDTGVPAVPGASCGMGSHCQSGKCVKIPGWTAPIYKPLTKYERQQLLLHSTTSKPEDCQ